MIRLYTVSTQLADGTSDGFGPSPLLFVSREKALAHVALIMKNLEEMSPRVREKYSSNVEEVARINEHRIQAYQLRELL